MGILVQDFAGQNWLIIPAALAVSDPRPADIFGQKWELTLTGVVILNFHGFQADDWRRDTFTILPDVQAPLQYAIDAYNIPTPPRSFTPAFNVDQWAPFATFSSVFDKDSGGVDAGFAVDAWRPSPFISSESGSVGVPQVFNGIDVDIAVRNTKAMLHRFSYRITLVGSIALLFGPG